MYPVKKEMLVMVMYSTNNKPSNIISVSDFQKKKEEIRKENLKNPVYIFKQMRSVGWHEMASCLDVPTVFPEEYKEKACEKWVSKCKGSLLYQATPLTPDNTFDWEEAYKYLKE